MEFQGAIPAPNPSGLFANKLSLAIYGIWCASAKVCVRNEGRAIEKLRLWQDLFGLRLHLPA